jgi:hypothetical protein
MVDGGTRVSICSTSPPTSVTVGVEIRGAASPTSGTGAFLTTSNAPAADVATTSLSSSRTMPITSYAPGRPSSTSATYTSFAASGSSAPELWNCACTSSDS